MLFECPFKYGVYLEKQNLLVCHPKGELTSAMMEDIAICRECILESGLFLVDRFHDLSDINSVNLEFDDIRQVCYKESGLRSSTRSIKACYLVPNDLLFGVIRMYQALIEGHGVNVYISKDLKKLANILGIDKTLLKPTWQS